MPDGTLQAIGVSPNCGAPDPRRRPADDDDDVKPVAQTQTTPPHAPAGSADLEIEKDGDFLGCPEGCLFFWTITLFNDGPNTATNVVVRDTFSSSITFLIIPESVETSQGTFTHPDGVTIGSTAGTWNVGTLAAGESATLEFCMLADVSEVTNTAEVIASGQHDPDSEPNNGDPEEDDQDSETVGGEFDKLLGPEARVLLGIDASAENVRLQPSCGIVGKVISR